MHRVDATDFWKWAYSDFLSNAQRGVLAEYIVAMAAGCTDRPRVEWDACDLRAPSGMKIEVKCGAYLQSWEQKTHSAIRFDIAPKRGWNATTNEYAQVASRSSHVYVFCVFAAEEKSTAEPLNLDEWIFLACPTRTLDERFGNQKSVRLRALEALDLPRLGFEALRRELVRMATDTSFAGDHPRWAD
ncbi:MAG: hypothetical protein NFCOHLIN_02081 [Gammaproteobacteria bacterium]|nr:hypothetical protein [Gammaproteobacteria bacterium]